MTCVRLGNGVIVCGVRRARKKKCGVIEDGHRCGETADLICDGCDVVLCRPHRVATTRNGEQLDFCPSCFAPVRRTWFAKLFASLMGSKKPTTPSRYELRVQFRQFAKDHPEAFDCIPLTALKPGETRSKA